MIRIDQGLWIGVGLETNHAAAYSITGLLNAAHDLQCSVGWNDNIECMQVGLIDGPGNLHSAYYAAVLSLSVLHKRHKNVMVYCHEGSRALAVAIMYLQTKARRRWHEWYNLVRERIDVDLPEVNKAHIDMFDKLNWNLLNKLIGEP